ncbi:MAG TPA: cupin domain-containing protein [Bryobacteraceae bacterium]|nr:cupin domain-containing protein [Bryobacteraceae bacterium]
MRLNAPFASLDSPVIPRNMRWHAGALIRVVASGHETSGEMAGIECIVQRRLEPPPHAHTREDEAVFVLDGEVEFTIGRKRVRADPGEWVFLPRGVRHSFTLRSEHAHLLMMFTPSGIENFFEVLSEPAEDEIIPASSLSYDNLFDMEYIMHVGQQFGIKFYPAKPARAAMTRSAAA